MNMSQKRASPDFPAGACASISVSFVSATRTLARPGSAGARGSISVSFVSATRTRARTGSAGARASTPVQYLSWPSATRTCVRPGSFRRLTRMTSPTLVGLPTLVFFAFTRLGSFQPQPHSKILQYLLYRLPKIPIYKKTVGFDITDTTKNNLVRASTASITNTKHIPGLSLPTLSVLVSVGAVPYCRKNRYQHFKCWYRPRVK